MNTLGAVVEQRLDRGVARRRNRRIAQWMMQRVAQKARAHRGDAHVEQAAQRRRRLAAQRFREFQIAPGGRVEAEEGAVALDDQRLHMRQGARLGRLRVAQQRAGGGDRGTQLIGPKAGERRRLEMGTQLARRRLGVEVPVRLAGQCGVRGKRQDEASAATISAGRMRSSVAGSFSSGTSHNLNSPLARLSQARPPADASCSGRAATRRACRRAARHRSAYPA
jgi:hypothetical protein